MLHFGLEILIEVIKCSKLKKLCSSKPKLQFHLCSFRHKSTWWQPIFLQRDIVLILITKRIFSSSSIQPIQSNMKCRVLIYWALSLILFLKKYRFDTFVCYHIQGGNLIRSAHQKELSQTLIIIFLTKLIRCIGLHLYRKGSEIIIIMALTLISENASLFFMTLGS